MPVLHTLRTLLPDAHIGWVTHRLAAGVLRDHPDLNDLIVLPRRAAEARQQGGWRQVFRDLRQQPWDVVLDLQGLAKSGLVSWICGARHRIGLGGAASREGNWLFMHQSVAPTGRSQNVIELNLSVLRLLGLDPGLVEPRVTLPDRPEDRAAIEHWGRSLGVAGERFVVVDPFAGWETKTWPREHWGQTLRALQDRNPTRALVFYGPKERLEAEELAAWWRKTQGIDVLLAPPTNLGEATALLRMHGELFLGGDTGPGHMAAALGLPTVMIFGPSCGERQAPRFAGARVRILQDRTHPCTDTFRRKCPLHQQPGHCMDRVSPEQVIAAAGELGISQIP